MMKRVQKQDKDMKKPFGDGAVALVRYGGLNLVKQKGNFGRDTYHSAPERFGYYAFIFPYIELFLIGSTKTVEFKAGVRKKFHAVDGYIWTHFKPEDPKDIIAVHNSWYKVPVSVMNKLIRKTYAEDCAMMQTYYHFKDHEKRIPWNEGADDPKVHRINPYSYASTDHMEVFVCRDTKIS